MGQEVDRDDESHALTSNPPPGLLVRRYAEECGELPFRRAMTAATCEITFEVAAPPPSSSVVQVLWGVSVAALAAFSLHHVAAAGALAAGAIVTAGGVVIQQRLPAQTITITPDHLEFLPERRWLALAEVRGVEVAPVDEGFAVQVATADGAVTVAMAKVASHARHIAAEIARAQRAHVGRGGQDRLP